MNLQKSWKAQRNHSFKKKKTPKGQQETCALFANQTSKMKLLVNFKWDVRLHENRPGCWFKFHPPEGDCSLHKHKLLICMLYPTVEITMQHN